MKRILVVVWTFLLNGAVNIVLPQAQIRSAVQHTSRESRRPADPSVLLLLEVSKPVENLAKVQTLIRAGANLEKHDMGAGVVWYTPLQYAVSLDHWKTAELLVKHGANVNPACPFGDEHYYTPLMHSARAGQLSLLKLLIHHGADVNAKAYHDLTALMVAAESGYTDIVRTLLRCGADMDAKSYFSHSTAAELAQRENHPDIVHSLHRYRRSLEMRRKRPKADGIGQECITTEYLLLHLSN